MWHWTCGTLTSACNCFNVAPEAGKLHVLLFICLDFSFVFLIKSENNRRITKALHRIVYIASGLTAALISFSLYVFICVCVCCLAAFLFVVICVSIFWFVDLRSVFIHSFSLGLFFHGTLASRDFTVRFSRTFLWNHP